MTVTLADPHGIRRAAAYIEQNGERYKLAEVEHPVRHFRWLRGAPEHTLKFTAGVKGTPQLKDGTARLIVEATSNDFRGQTVEAARDVVVVTQPVKVSVDSDQHYLYLGMADLVTYNVSGSPTASGVRVGDESFRGWPMPGGKPGQFSLFAFAWNMPLNTVPAVYAIGPGGDEAHGQMVINFPKREQPKYRVRDLQIDDKFMEKVVSELDPNRRLFGSLLERKVEGADADVLRGPRRIALEDLDLDPLLVLEHRIELLGALSRKHGVSMNSRRILATTCRARSTSGWRHRMTDAWFGPHRSESTATASSSTTATACRRSMAI